jgi:S1-C subfamily serine protease
LGDVPLARACNNRGMAITTLTDISNQLADAVASAARSVVQVHGRRQPASGVVHDTDIVVTTTRAIGREDGLSVRTPDGRDVQAELIGWDPATHLVALRATGLELPAATMGAAPRVGHIAVAIGRSWSNALTASAGIVSVIGGPLPTGRGRAIEEIIRTTAPMHRGFAGGAFVNTSGELLGITTAAEIRGLGVVIPSGIAAKTLDSLIKHGRAKRRYIGVAGQGVELPVGQRPGGQANGVLVVRVIEGSPAEKAGLLVGDVLIALDGQELESPDRLLDALASSSGPASTLRVLRGAAASDVVVEIGEK